ncbi:MAG: DNA polymerase III subunit delta [Clostridia bacterium]
MNYETIKEQLNSGVIHHICLLYGDEDFLIEALVKRMEKQILGDRKNPMCHNVFSGPCNEEDVVSAVNTYPMLNDSRLVVCRDTGFFKTSKKRDKLAAMLDDMPGFSHVLFLEKEVDRTSPLFQQVQKMKKAFRIDHRSAEDIIRYITERFKRNRKIISQENARLFFHYSGVTLLDIESDIEKILLYMGDAAHVKPEHIANLCSGIQEARIYELFDQVCMRNKDKSLMLLKSLLSNKTPAQVILVSLHGGFMELLAAKDAGGSDGRPDIRRKGSLVPDFILRKIMERSRKYTAGQLGDAVKLISHCDVSIKAGDIHDGTALEVLVASLVML